MRTVTLENVTTDHLREVLETVDESAAVERLMAAITYTEIDATLHNATL